MRPPTTPKKPQGSMAAMGDVTQTTTVSRASHTSQLYGRVAKRKPLSQCLPEGLVAEKVLWSN